MHWACGMHYTLCITEIVLLSKHTRPSSASLHTFAFYRKIVWNQAMTNFLTVPSLQKCRNKLCREYDQCDPVPCYWHPLWSSPMSPHHWSQSSYFPPWCSDMNWTASGAHRTHKVGKGTCNYIHGEIQLWRCILKLVASVYGVRVIPMLTTTRDVFQ